MESRSIGYGRGVSAAASVSTTHTRDSPAIRVSRGAYRLVPRIAIGAAFLILVWLFLAVVSKPVPFAVLSREASIGVESAAAFARFFSALVLMLVPAERGGRRLRWVAAGMVALGIGGLAFGSLESVLGSKGDLNTLSYESMVVRVVASALFCVGLVPARPPALTWPRALIVGALGLTMGALVASSTSALPRLVRPISLVVAAKSSGPLPGLSDWYWALSLFTLGLVLAGLVGAYKCYSSQLVGGWLLLAMVVLAGSQVHNIAWPSTYSSLLTTGDVLRLLFAAIVVAGGVLELRFMAAERARLLAASEAQSRRLVELARTKEDLTRMVLHEFSAPVAAIRGFSAMLATGALTSVEQTEAIATIRTQTDILSRLVRDVETAATVERADFGLQLTPTPVRTLLADITAYARTLPSIQLEVSASLYDQMVLADRTRVGQVLSNLLDNAAKYCPSGARVFIRATAHVGYVRFEVADNGPGIDPDDLPRVFEKFGRSQRPSQRDMPGLGMGLYLSRQIIETHGSKLTVRSELGTGSTFSFDLRSSR